MWPGGMILWIALPLVGALILALRFVLAPRLHSVATSGVLLVLIAVVGVNTASGWGLPPKSPWLTAPLPSQQTIRLRALDFALRRSVIRLRALEFAFRPSAITALPGVPLTLELINSGFLEHTIVIPALGVQATLLPGERRIVHVGGVEAGAYEFFCAIPAHRKAGMMGQLVVVDSR